MSLGAVTASPQAGAVEDANTWPPAVPGQAMASVYLCKCTDIRIYSHIDHKTEGSKACVVDCAASKFHKRRSSGENSALGPGPAEGGDRRITAKVRSSYIAPLDFCYPKGSISSLIGNNIVASDISIR